MAVVALAGGIGAARFLTGLVQVVGPADLTVVVNTGDDIVLHGLRVSPDLDTVAYTLGGGVDLEQGWGRADETLAVARELRDRYGRPDWFTLGDRDLATHLVRTEILAGGGTLSEATAVIAGAWGVGPRLLPMTDDPVQTRILTADGRDLHFQQWWIAEAAAPAVADVHLRGADDARPAPGVLEAIGRSEVVLLCPSNPVVSIGTILAVPGIRGALRAATVIGVSPIVGGRVVRGMADRLLPVLGVETSATGVASLYADILDGWVIDRVDAAATADLQAAGLRVGVTDTIMRTAAVAADLARTALGLAVGGRPG